MSEPDPEELLKAAQVPQMVITATIALAFTALGVGLVGVQNLTLVQWRPPWNLFPWVLTALGAACVVVAAKLHRARAWTLPVALPLTIVTALAVVGFFIFALLSGVFSLLGVIAAPIAVLTVVLEGLALAPFRELIALRRKLKQAGYDLDL